MGVNEGIVSSSYWRSFVLPYNPISDFVWTSVIKILPRIKNLKENIQWKRINRIRPQIEVIVILWCLYKRENLFAQKNIQIAWRYENCSQLTFFVRLNLSPDIIISIFKCYWLSQGPLQLNHLFEGFEQFHHWHLPINDLRQNKLIISQSKHFTAIRFKIKSWMCSNGCC